MTNDIRGNNIADNGQWIVLLVCTAVASVFLGIFLSDMVLQFTSVATIILTTVLLLSITNTSIGKNLRNWY